MNFVELENFIEINNGASIEFGTEENAPSDTWIERAECDLGVKLPPSYIWFLKNYGGGEIHGDEIFSIYEIPFDEASGGDVVFQTISDRRNEFIKESEVLICSTDFGEQFVMDVSRRNEKGEYPIVRKVGNHRKDFANSFADFIVKFVGDAAIE